MVMRMYQINHLFLLSVVSIALIRKNVDKDVNKNVRLYDRNSWAYSILNVFTVTRKHAINPIAIAFFRSEFILLLKRKTTGMHATEKIAESALSMPSEAFGKTFIHKKART